MSDKHHDDLHNIYDLGLQADLKMWTKVICCSPNPAGPLAHWHHPSHSSQ